MRTMRELSTIVPFLSYHDFRCSRAMAGAAMATATSPTKRNLGSFTGSPFVFSGRVSFALLPRAGPWRVTVRAGSQRSTAILPKTPPVIFSDAIVSMRILARKARHSVVQSWHQHSWSDVVGTAATTGAANKLECPIRHSGCILRATPIDDREAKTEGRRAADNVEQPRWALSGGSRS
jgi:hypothetical protein